jgi:hypothetical protein
MFVTTKAFLHHTVTVWCYRHIHRQLYGAWWILHYTRLSEQRNHAACHNWYLYKGRHFMPFHTILYLWHWNVLELLVNKIRTDQVLLTKIFFKHDSYLILTCSQKQYTTTNILFSGFTQNCKWQYQCCCSSLAPWFILLWSGSRPTD